MALPHTGAWKTPELNVSEMLAHALRRPLNQSGGSNIIPDRIQNIFSGQGASASTGNRDQILGDTTQNFSPANFDQSKPGDGSGFNNILNKTGGNSGGGVPGNPSPTPGYDVEGGGRDSINAQSGVFDARIQGLRNRIPELEAALGLRVKGIQQGLEEFMGTAEAEKAKRLGEIDLAKKGAQEQTVQAERSTRTTAQSLARQLRNQFASRGSLDSSQYRDFSIDQSRDVAQSIGDISREGASRQGAFDLEAEDIKNFYSTQVTAQQRQAQLQIEEANQQADAQKRSILDDINLTDAQKVEAITNAENSLSETLANIEAKRQQAEQELQIKMQGLRGKELSNSFKSAKEQNTAIQNANTILQQYEERFGTTPTADQAVQIYIDQGLDEETARRYATFLFTGEKEGSQYSVDELN